MAVPPALRGPVAGPGLRISAGLAVAALLLLPFAGPWGAGGVLLVAAANLAFFRNPRRAPPPGEGGLVSPADGRVVEVVGIEDPDGFVGPAQRVAVFLSILDGHVQRAPASGKVRAVRRRGTRFLAAFRSDASRHNSQTRIDIEGATGARFAVVQIAGLVARRVVCYPTGGESLSRGDPYGLICYGSRVELYVPASATIRVRVGDRVRAGETVVAEVET